MTRTDALDLGRRRLWVLALIGATASCATGRSVDQLDPFDATASENELRLTVHNHETRNATVYVYWNGMRERVGYVLGMKSETFQFEWRAEVVQIGYELLGRRAVAGGTDSYDGYRSEPIEVSPGDHLDFVIMDRGGDGS